MILLTLTPLHIGDGEELSPFDYIIETVSAPSSRKLLKVYPLDYLLNKLSEKYTAEALHSRLSLLKSWVQSPEALKRFSLKEYFREANIAFEPKYQLEIKNQNSSIEGKRIKTFVKNLEGFYIPGSEIKGALRTVFIYGILKNNPTWKNEIYKKLEITLRNLKNSNLNKKKQTEEIEKFFHKEIESLIFRPKGTKDAQFDLFKSLLISDSEPISYDKFYVDFVKVLNTSREISEPHELLKPNQKISLRVFLDEKIALEGLKKVGLLEQGFYNPNLEKVTWSFLKESAIDFYLSLINHEKTFLSRKDLPNKEKLLENLNHLENLINRVKNESKIIIPLRIGKHQGYLSTTLMLLLKQEKEDLFNEIFKISAPIHRNELNKTRKITLSDYNFLGWCMLVVK
ncbi:MAG: type III-A CRISPR-associated RAMP protein Csm5 [Caldimicrobium sp.]